MRFVHFMNSTTGRAIRAVTGLVLIAVGLVVGGSTGWVLGLVGLVPLAAGVFGFCLLAPLFRAPMGYGHGSHA